MNEDVPDRKTRPDSPWRDVPADSDTVPGTEEPDPAEVVGDEGEERDIATAKFNEPTDFFQQDTLDERLAEEEPELTLVPDLPDPEAGELQTPERGGDDVLVAEADPDPDDDPDEPAAEDAAIHIDQQ